MLKLFFSDPKRSWYCHNTVEILRSTLKHLFRGAQYSVSGARNQIWLLLRLMFPSTWNHLDTDIPVCQCFEVARYPRLELCSLYRYVNESDQNDR